VVLLGGVVVVAGVTVAVVGSLAPRSCGCARPPVLAGVAGTPRRWAQAVTGGQVDVAWRLLTPAAQHRYRDVAGLRAALPDLAASLTATRAADWYVVAVRTGGAGTDTSLVEALVDDGLRLVDAIVVQTRADGSDDGRVDPDTVPGLRIAEPAAGADVGSRPRLRVQGGPGDGSDRPDYAAVGADRTVRRGAVGAIRAGDGFDEPFRDADLPAGPTLIVAAYHTSSGWQVDGVSVQVAAAALGSAGP
jgi:hypothetical protein